MKKNKGFTLIEILVVLAILTLVFGSVIVSAFVTFRTTYLTAKVTDKIVKPGSSHSSKYLIITDKEVLENTDSLIRGKFNSSDYYAKLKKGETYKFKLAGYRIPFLSMYRNVITYNKVGK